MNTAFGYACFVVFLRLQLHYSVAVILSTIVGVFFNFKTIGRLVFQSRSNRRLLRFVACYVVVCGINLVGLRLFISIGVGPYWGGAALLLPLAMIAYFLQKRFVFPTSNGGDGNPSRGRPRETSLVPR